jgi:predicted ribosomally synthesized peptide with SipW-like signal peptide
VKKKLLLLTLALLLVAGMAGAGTFAYFSDTETSTGNTFTAGTLDLKIKDGGEWWSDGIATAEWALSNMKPGDTAYGSVDLKNFGSVYANHVEIACDYTITDPPGPESDTEENTSADKMAGEMVITTMIYSYNADEVDCLPRITDANGNGVKDLYDLKASGGVDDLPLVQSGTQFGRLDMIVRFDPNAGNDFQGDTLNLTVVFTLNQDASQ